MHKTFSIFFRFSKIILFSVVLCDVLISQIEISNKKIYSKANCILTGLYAVQCDCTAQNAKQRNFISTFLIIENILYFKKKLKKNPFLAEHKFSHFKIFLTE